MKLLGEGECGIVASFLFADAMALQFDVHIVRAEGLNECTDQASSFIHSTSFECGGKRSFIAPGQADHPSHRSLTSRSVATPSPFVFCLSL